MASELKSCPFCGGQAILCKNTFNSLVSVECTDCGCSTPTKYSIKDVVDIWNARFSGGVICDNLNKNRLWANHDVYECLINNPNGVIIETVGEDPILVTHYPKLFKRRKKK